MKIYIKNMVCSRCIMVVTSTLKDVGLHPLIVSLGEVELEEEDISNVKDLVKDKLNKHGFALLDDRKSRTIEKIKSLIIDLVQNRYDDIGITLSEYLSQELHQGYHALSRLFSEVEGITIEKYHILQKVEKVKELLVYDELSLSQIAHQLNYSSPAYLSNQFKRVTGLTPSHFKKLGAGRRRPLEEL